ncbi:MAG: 50S ribosomal protein L17 [bacterium]
MRHRKKGNRLGRFSSERRALLRNLVTALFKNGSIITTEAKAKEMIPLAERVISIAKRQNLTSIRRLSGIIYEKEVAKKLYSDVSSLDRESGHFRIFKLGIRQGDSAQLVKVSLIK